MATHRDHLVVHKPVALLGLLALGRCRRHRRHLSCLLDLGSGGIKNEWKERRQSEQTLSILISLVIRECRIGRREFLKEEAHDRHDEGGEASKLKVSHTRALSQSATQPLLSIYAFELVPRASGFFAPFACFE